MARRRAQARRWHIGDRCLAPRVVRMVFSPPQTRTYWQPGVVTAVRGDRLVVTVYGWEYLHPWWELRPPGRAQHGR